VAHSRAMEFRQWVISEIEKLPPNTCLPPDREMVSHWGLSPITIQRTLAKLRDEGKLVRIPGKGTFTPDTKHPSDRPMEAKEGVLRDSAAEHLTKSLIRMIAEGVYRKGKPLPPVKYLRSHFKVSSETITLAYQNMENLGYVEKIGKNYWVGRIDRLLAERPRREVFFLRFGPGDFSSIFNSDPIALAFQKMERELYHSGYFLHPENADNLEGLLKKWETSQQYPAGLVFYAVDGTHLPFFRNLFTRYAVALKKHRVRVLVHGQNNDLSDITRHASVFSRGNVETDMARVLAHHLLDKGCREAILCVHESEFEERYRANFFLKIALSIQSIIPGFKFRLIIRPKPDSTHSLGFVQSLGPDYRKYLESKFPGADLNALEQAIEFEPDVFEACRRHRDAKLWIFARDKMAAEGLQWLENQKISVPKDISVIGFENDPRYYHFGISTCGPDWDVIGYVMAHSIIGDVKMALTQKGFLKVRCNMLDKLTTLH
jgi:DNA-binding transcriptional regulator YhcF (GntR family)